MEKREFSIIDVLILSFKFLLRYWWLFVLGIAFGLLVSWLHTRHLTGYYESGIYARTGLLSKNLIYDYSLLYYDLKNVQSHIFLTSVKNPNAVYLDKDALYKYLHYKDAHLLGFKVSIVKHFASEPAIYISIQATDKSEFSKFKNGLLYYFSHKSPLIKLYQRQKQILVDSIRDIQNQIKPFIKQGITLDLSSFYSKYLYLYKYSYPLFYYITDFYQINFVSPDYKSVYIKNIIVYFFLSFLVALAIEGVKWAAKVYKNYTNEQNK